MAYLLMFRSFSLEDFSSTRMLLIWLLSTTSYDPLLFTYRTGYDVYNSVIMRWRNRLILETRLLLEDLR